MTETATPFVSVIVPVLNDADVLRCLLSTLEPADAIEIIVVDGGSRGTAMVELKQQFPSCRWTRSRPGRGIQMNTGARGARGSWLLFLHADTQPPTNWLAEIHRADTAAGAVWGCFAFGLDSRDWRARVIERAVALRVRYLGLPYGDQALFVRRDVFTRIGGFADIPLMEDVELVRRLHHEGPGWFSSVPALTSARRWHREGWLRRSAKNISLLLQYVAGASPAALAKKYYGSEASTTGSRAALIVMARAPSDPAGKTRLVAGLPEERATCLRRALLLDTLAGLDDVRDVADIVVQYTPPDARLEFQQLEHDLILAPQAGAELGARMHDAALQRFEIGYDVVIIVGSDVPTITSSIVRQAIDTLSGRTAEVVLGPAEDGGYYVIGLTHPEAGLFRGVESSRSTVLAQTKAAAERLKFRVEMLPTLRDVDTPDDLNAVIREEAPHRLANVRAWLDG